MMVKQEFKVNGEVKKTRHTEAANIPFPPFERSEAAAQKIHELMHADPFPSQDEIFNTPELLAQVEEAARNAPIGGVAPRKLWATRVQCRDKKGRVVSAIPPDEQEVDLGDDLDIEDANVDEGEQVEEQPQQLDEVAPDYLMRDYLLTRARMITGGEDYVETYTNQELADLCALSTKRFITFEEWVSRRYPE